MRFQHENNCAAKGQIVEHTITSRQNSHFSRNGCKVNHTIKTTLSGKLWRLRIDASKSQNPWNTPTKIFHKRERMEIVFNPNFFQYNAIALVRHDYYFFFVYKVFKKTGMLLCFYRTPEFLQLLYVRGNTTGWPTSQSSCTKHRV